MNILDRYIAKSVIESTLLVLLVLLGIETFITFVSELRDIGTKDYGLWQALTYVPMLLPSNIYQFFPMAGLIGSLMALGRMASRSELIVMRASGVSVTQVISAVLKAAIVLLIFAIAIGEWIGPDAQRHAQLHKAEAMSGGQAITTMQGIWVRDGDNFLHIILVPKKGEVIGVTRYHFSNAVLDTASYAQSGVYVNDHWLFRDVDTSFISKDKVTTAHYAEQTWDVNLDPHLLGMTDLDPDQQSLPKLREFISYLDESGQDSNHYEFMLYKRLFQPLATLIMICLGVPFVFGPLRSVTMGLRILAGIVTGFAFYTLNQLFGPFSMVYQVPPLLAAALPTVLFGIIGGFLLWRTR